jgi:hypothetical protein
MNRTHNPPTKAEINLDLRRLDLQFRDTLILKDGAAVQVVQELDGLVEVAGYKKRFINRFEIARHYPFNAQTV